MESLEESNCHSMSDSFSLYERYLRSFNVVDNFVEEDNRPEPIELASTRNSDYNSSNSVGNIDLSVVASHNVINKHCETADIECKLLIPTTCNNLVDKKSPLYDDLGTKVDSPCASLAGSFDNSSGTVNCLLNEKSDPIEVPVSSDDSKFEPFKHPLFITSTMENSNNAVDSVPMFGDIRKSESVFKLPISELSFNGTIKHVKKLKPIVDPITALTSNNGLVNLDEKTVDSYIEPYPSGSNDTEPNNMQKDVIDLKARSSNDSLSSEKNNLEKVMESSGDSQYEEFGSKKGYQANEEASNVKWNSEQSYSSLEASFDSGVRSPDLFSDEDGEEAPPKPEPFWSFLKEFEAHDKKKVRKIEKTLQGVLPPPSVTILKTDVTEMLKKYYCFLPAFTEGSKNHIPEVNSMTPTKRVSFIQIPTETESLQSVNENVTHCAPKCGASDKSKESSKSDTDLDVSVNDKSIEIKLCTQVEAAETSWPEIMKCKYYDVYYNVTTYSEKYELLAQKYGERYVGAETDTSVNIYSGGLQSPSSASKRKALRLKMAQAKSPGRRLSHLARRRQAFCSAATINEKAQASQSRMVLIDKNFFPHRKLINSSERRSPRFKRTPGKNTPIRKTPGKKTPAKTPKTRSGGSSRKKAMRRLLMDPESMTRSQPTRETLKRALFISPENRKVVPTPPSTSVPLQAMRSKRALFGSPELAQTKSSDGSLSDQFLKRKRDIFDEEPDNRRSKIAKSLSFGGDTIGNMQSHSFARRASEACVSSTVATSQLNATHKKKLLWAVSEALRPHGWSMSSPGFREKASALAQLTRKMLMLPPHAARLASPNLSTSDTMLKLARQYVFAIIQGRSVDDCFEEEQVKVANEATTKVTGYISASAYQQLKARQATNTTSKIKENTCDVSTKQEQPKSTSKNILQDKLVNIDANSSSSSGFSMLDKSSLGMFKSNSMPSFEEAAKMRARRQISFDNIDFPKR